MPDHKCYGMRQRLMVLLSLHIRSARAEGP
jgi:hypothetical protein